MASGSDDGNFFIWNKPTGTLHGIYEGDSSVVNMVEGHPTLPLIAVSGIDTTVKVSLDVFNICKLMCVTVRSYLLLHKLPVPSQG